MSVWLRNDALKAWLEALPAWRLEAQNHKDPVARINALENCDANERWVLSQLWRSF